MGRFDEYYEPTVRFLDLLIDEIVDKAGQRGQLLGDGVHSGLANLEDATARLNAAVEKNLSRRTVDLRAAQLALFAMYVSEGYRRADPALTAKPKRLPKREIARARKRAVMNGTGKAVPKAEAPKSTAERFRPFEFKRTWMRPFR